MLALALCSIAIIYLYGAPIVRPTIRHCCRKARRPVSAEIINKYSDL